MALRTKISFITTVFNEESTINTFIDSILQQSLLPSEIIIVDGGSTDRTVTCLEEIKKKSKEKTPIRIFVKKGNRSVGRNEAIRKAEGDIILCTDAGNILDRDWIKNISNPFSNTHVDVVAGYYKGVAETVFQKCVIPYALVMPDKVDPDNFLPATRSVAFKKSIWREIGGFDEKYSHNEDYVFAHKLKQAGAKIVFVHDAIVYWMPRNTFRQAFIMMYRFAYGDAEARIIRPKVVFVFFRYIAGLALLILGLLTSTVNILADTLLIFVLYFLWSIVKNYGYVKKWQALYILPILQLLADLAVVKGTVLGLLKKRITL